MLNIVPELRKIPDKEYFSLGKVDLFDHKALITSASFFTNAYETDLYQVLLMGTKISDDLQYIFNVGNAFHCYVLENEDFEKRYYVSDFKNSFNEYKIYINSEDFIFIKKCYENIKIKYPFILDESDMNEVAVRTDIDGVPYKGKIDKLIQVDSGIVIVDLKSVWHDFYSSKFKRSNDGQLWNLKKELKALNYDLRGYCYYRGIEEYLRYKEVNTHIKFKLLLCSKESFDVKMVTFSEDMMLSGKEKFDFIFPQVKSFYDFGYEKVDKDEYI